MSAGGSPTWVPGTEPLSGAGDGHAPGPPSPPTTDPAATVSGTGGGDPPRRGMLTPGGVWGRWTLRKRIRSGGSAQVWRATDAEGERAALKFLLQPDAGVELRRFRRERDLSERLQGKWLPKVLDSDLGDLVPWIAFEYLDFPALDQLVTASGPLTGEALVIFTRDLWDALLSLHEHGVAHRDLSARNVLIDVDDGRLRLIDLGSGTAGDGTMITQDVFPASLGFAAPEQLLMSESRVGPAADLWSWAAVVHYAATGRTIFPVEPRMAYLDHVRAGAAPDLSGVPATVRPALAAALRFDPAARRADEITGALPLRRHEADLQAAETRLADAGAEIRALRAAVAAANEKLAQQDPTAPHRLAELQRQAEVAAAEAADARRQLESTALATRRATGAFARVTELRDALAEAERQRGQAAASDAQVRQLQARLAQADAELAHLRRPAPPASLPPLPQAPPVLLPAPAASSPRRAGPAAARRRPRRLVSALLTSVLVAIVFLGVSGHPAFSRADWSAPQQEVVRFTAGFLAAAGAFIAAMITRSVLRVVSFGSLRPALWKPMAAITVLVLGIAYLAPDLPQRALDSVFGAAGELVDHTDPDRARPSPPVSRGGYRR